MTYSNLYYAEWASPGNLQGYLYIDRVDYVGGASLLKLSADSLSINYAFGDWNNPIIGMQCEFDILNDKADFYELLPLLTAEERQYKIRVVITYPTAYTLFEGFINCDTISQRMLHKQVIKFAASSYLYKLDNSHVLSIDTLQNKTFIDIIDEILRSTGANYNIRVNCKLHAQGDVMAIGQTLFNKNGFYTELFWEDEVNRSTSLIILKAILTSFDCYLYWWRGYWHIERYEDIWSESVDFVEYVSGHSYLPNDIGLEPGPSDDSDAIVHIDQVITDVHSLVFTGQSQRLDVIPGLKTIKINLEDKRVFNLVLSSLKDAIPTVATVPAPDYRTFQIYQEVLQGFYTGNIIWKLAGLPKSNIANAIERWITTNLDLPNYQGLYTCFKVTVDNADVSINIKFKYYLDLTQITGWSKRWEDYSLDFSWFLRIAGRNDYIIQSAEDWSTKLGASSGIINDSLNGVMQLINFGGDSFNRGTKTLEVSITIPIGKVETYFDGHNSGPITGDQTLIFGLGLERLHSPNEEITTGKQVRDCFIGDFNITATGGLQSNVIEANVSGAKFLNKKDISMTLYDMESYNYKNGILRGDSLTIRTERWGVLGGVSNILRKGICWKTSTGPTIADARTDEGTGFSAFTSLMTNLIPNTTYYVRAYSTSEAGTTYGNELSFTTANLQIGSPHQGGIIFYFLQPGDEGYDSVTRKGLIAALTDQSTGVWWASLTGWRSHSWAGAVEQRIGSGLRNSNLMNGDYKCTEYAVSKCLDYETGIPPNDYTDWYLPSVRELEKLRLQKDIVKGFSPGWYWSSSQCSNSSNLSLVPPDLPPITNARKKAWAVDFANTGPNPTPIDYWDKNNSFRIRAIRSFIET